MKILKAEIVEDDEDPDDIRQSLHITMDDGNVYFLDAESIPDAVELTQHG